MVTPRPTATDNHQSQGSARGARRRTFEASKSVATRVAARARHWIVQLIAQGFLRAIFDGAITNPPQLIMEGDAPGDRDTNARTLYDPLCAMRASPATSSLLSWP